MRLWHYRLLPVLDDRRLVRQHCECCALRGKGWGKKHATVDYVFKHSPALLVSYHYQVMTEMARRGYKVNPIWVDPFYRGKELGDDYDFFGRHGRLDVSDTYPEHDDEYYEFCLRRLAEKGAKLNGKPTGE